jgi:hypothetical protein
MFILIIFKHIKKCLIVVRVVNLNRQNTFYIICLYVLTFVRTRRKISQKLGEVKFFLKIDCLFKTVVSKLSPMATTPKINKNVNYLKSLT